MRFGAIVAFFMCTVACAQSASVVSALKPSEINAKPSLHDGKVISVNGYLESSPEGTAIWDASSDIHNRKVGVDHCLSVMFPDSAKAKVSKYNGERVTLTGSFDADITKKYQIILGLCNKTTITLDGPEGLTPSESQ